MAYVEVRKNGLVVMRNPLEGEDRPEGWLITLTDEEGQAVLRVGESGTIGPYEVEVFAGQIADQPGATLDEVATPRTPPLRTNLDVGAAVDPPSEVAASLPNVEGYKILASIGEGGMGTVWRAVQLSTDRPVALKFLRAGAFGSQRSRARFEREVKLSARLEHPNIARVYDSGLLHGVYYYAMELIDGLSLDRYIRKGGLSRRQIMELMHAVCLAVDYAHTQGVIHRDLKPSNILVTPDGQPHVLDFGLAKTLLHEDSVGTISVVGEISGTPGFMSPEQAAGKTDQIDTRSDVYSLGVILYHQLTGQAPHDMTGSRYDIVRRIVEEDVRPPSTIRADIDTDLEMLLMTALNRDQECRYSSAGEMAGDIGNYLSGMTPVAHGNTATLAAAAPPARKSRGVWVALLVVLVLIAAGGGGYYWKFLRSKPPPAPIPPDPRSQSAPGPTVALKDVVPLKTRAEMAWAKVKDVDRGQGFAARIDDVQVIQGNAKAFFEKAAYTDAKRCYEQVIVKTAAVAALQAQRASAIVARDVSDTSAGKAGEAEAAKKAKTAWDQAVALAAKAKTAFEGGEFTRAEATWKSADEQYRAAADLVRPAVVTTAPTAPTFESLLAEAKSLQQAGKKAEALAKVKVALAKRPGDAVAMALKKQLEPPPATKPVAANPLALDLPGGVTIKLVRIAAGKFSMGSPQSDKDRQAEDGPPRDVTISKPFYMGVTEVTVGQFAAFVTAEKYKTDAEKSGGASTLDGDKWRKVETASWRKPGLEGQTDAHPVVCVSWNDADAFCKWLTARGRRRVHLPTEAQWEYACRAGTTTTYQWGDDAAGGRGWCNVADETVRKKFPKWPAAFSWSDGTVFTSPAGGLKPNAWGLADMHGNVWEWCADWYGLPAGAGAVLVDPHGPATGKERVLRGGAWSEGPVFCRSACRNYQLPDFRGSGIGFRVAVAAE